MTTMRHKLLGMAGAAVVLATAALGGSAGVTEAAPKSPAQLDCEANPNHVWVDGEGCAKEQCQKKDGSRHKHGTVYPTNGLVLRCNGFTGKWEIVLAHQGPVHVLTHVLEPAAPPLLHEDPSAGPAPTPAPRVPGGVFAPR